MLCPLVVVYCHIAAGADAVMGWLGLVLGYCSRRFRGWVSMHGAVGVRGCSILGDESKGTNNQRVCPLVVVYYHNAGAGAGADAVMVHFQLWVAVISPVQMKMGHIRTNQ